MELFPGLTQSMSFFFCKAMDNVVSYHHEFLMPEHLLLSIIDHPEVVRIMRRMKIDQKSMRQELDAWFTAGAHSQRILSCEARAFCAFQGDAQLSLSGQPGWRSWGETQCDSFPHCHVDASLR